MGIESEGIHTKGRQMDVVKRRMERRAGRKVEQEFQLDIGPGDGLEARGLGE